MAATQSALAENPHSRQVNCAGLFGLSPEVCPHSRHWRLVFIGGNATSMPPRHLVLYSNWRRSSNGLASRMERFRPDLALTLLPGCSLVPAADANIFFTCRSSTMTTAWFLLMSDETLCRKCFLVLAMRWYSWVTFAFFQLFGTFLLLADRRCHCLGLGKNFLSGHPRSTGRPSAGVMN